MPTIDWASVGSVATATAVAVAAWQIRLGAHQSRTDFEDDLSREYRELSRSIPAKVHLGEALTKEEFQVAFPRLFQYVDLSNEQIFLRKNGRISKATWCNWRDGIKANLSRPAFAKAWELVKSRSGDGFSELRRVEEERFETDPRRWLPLRRRLLG